MSIISFTVERHYRKYLLAGLKAKLLSSYPKVNLLTISNDVSNIMEAVYTMSGTYRHFPKKSIHFVFVEYLIGASKPPLLLEYDGHYFITADNGFIPLFLELRRGDNMEGHIFQLKNETLHTPFDDIEVYLSVLPALLEGNITDSLFLPTDSIQQLHLPKVNRLPEESGLEGQIVFFDSYGNAVTNICQTDLEPFLQAEFTIQFQFYPGKIDRISYFYGEVDPGELFAIFNQHGFLEIGIFRDSAKELLALSVGQHVDIRKE